MPRLREALDEWRPDLVLRESAEFGSLVAGELHGVSLASVSRRYAVATACLVIDRPMAAHLAAQPSTDHALDALLSRVARPLPNAD